MTTIRLFLYAIILLFPTVTKLHSQTLEGTTGLFFIPTAEMQKDGTVIIGANFVDRKLISFSGYHDNAVTPYLTFTFLPFIEFNIRITRLIDSEVTTQGIGDRAVNARLQFISESDNFPALALGIHDLLAVFGGTQAIHNNAFYVVSTKSVRINSFINNIELSLGYGTDIMKARTHNFVGIFGGISIKFFNAVELMGEYDAKRINAGMRINLFNHIHLLGGFLDMKYFTGGFSYYFQL